MSYYNRLKSIEILPLSHRPEYLDLVFVYNLYHDLTDIDINILLSPADNGFGTRTTDKGILTLSIVYFDKTLLQVFLDCKKLEPASYVY